MRKSRIWAALTIALALTALVGCNQQWTPTGAAVSTIKVDVDGRKIDCITVGSSSVSCDWHRK